MNQQRSRRFRSAQEAKEKDEDKQELLKMLKSQGGGQVGDSTNDAMNNGSSLGEDEDHHI
jgi:5'-3' exoribonuclease 2